MREIGARYRGQGECEFVVWAPLIDQLSLCLLTPQPRCIPLSKDADGYFHASVDQVRPGDRYRYWLNGREELPDPASYFQPEDVAGHSCVVDHGAFVWQDRGWQGVPWEQVILYEIHVGTFTAAGTFSAAGERLEELRQLGVTAIEVMPVAQFPGARNWGYDGVFPFAVQHSYGGPDGFKTFVNACHGKGIAVFLDVVYNHLGPEGNVLPQYMPCVTDSYRTPWGKAMNYDGAYSFGVRNYVIQNALYWLRQYHVDGLRLDAVHGIFDQGAIHILQELSAAVNEFSQQQGRKYYVVAESDLNDIKLVRPYDRGGYGLDAQWSDDFHHALHTILTQEQTGYYEDFGSLSHMAKAMCEGFVYTGGYSKYRKRNHGSRTQDIPADKFVVCLQNHDQIGNRLRGERIASLVPWEGLKVAAAAVLLAPYIPLLFMGEEYGEQAPFLYFMSFHDPGLIQAVREGRKREFAAFGWNEEPPDPYAEETFRRSRLQRPPDGDQGASAILRQWYAALITLRRRTPALTIPAKTGMSVRRAEDEAGLVLIRRHDTSAVCALLNFRRVPAAMQVACEERPWRKILDSADPRWQGPGSSAPERLAADARVEVNPLSVVLYEKEV